MQSYAQRVLRPLYDRADHSKVILWSTMHPVWSPALDRWVSLRMWHVWCGTCGINECCRKSLALYTSSEARAVMAKHWKDVHN